MFLDITAGKWEVSLMWVQWLGALGISESRIRHQGRTAPGKVGEPLQRCYEKPRDMCPVDSERIFIEEIGIDNR